MKAELSISQQPQEDGDAELQRLVKLAETALDAKTREFIAEALRHVPEEPVSRYETEVSHEGVFCGNEG